MFMGIQIEGRVWEVWLISVVIFVITGLILYQKKRSFSYLFFCQFSGYTRRSSQILSFFRWLLVGLLLKLAGGHARCRQLTWRLFILVLIWTPEEFSCTEYKILF